MPPFSTYEIFSDGGSRGNPGPGASAFVVYKDKAEIYHQAYFFKHTTNNIAEYFAVLMAVTWVEKNVKVAVSEKLNFYLDSELVVKQLRGVYKIKNPKLKNIYEKIVKAKKELGKSVSFNYIPREENYVADSLVNEKMDENI